jgi:hypothetical protein
MLRNLVLTLLRMLYIVFGRIADAFFLKVIRFTYYIDAFFMLAIFIFLHKYLLMRDEVVVEEDFGAH